MLLPISMDSILDKFGKDTIIFTYDDKSFRTEVDVAVSNVFFSWVFGFGGAVVIDSPAEVKEQYRAMIQKVSEGL